MPDINPTNPEISVAALQSLLDGMLAAQSEQHAAAIALKGKCDAADAAERIFHDAIQQIKAGVIAQYGKDSDQVAAIGLKKRSHYKRRSPKSPTAVKPAV